MTSYIDLLASHDRLAAKLEKVASWLDRLAKDADAGAARSTRFTTLGDAYRADAKNYRAVAVDIRKVLKP